MARYLLIFAILAVLIGVSSYVVRADFAPSDGGAIPWSAEPEAARRLASHTGKPLLILHAGPSSQDAEPLRRALSHPILLDASAEFVPLVLQGAERGTISFEDCRGNPIAQERQAETSVAALLDRMRSALRAAGRPIPAYLDLVAFEYNPKVVRSATFTLGCYWKGERHLGNLPGIVATRTGFVGADEAVQVEFDPTALSYSALLGEASQIECFKGAVEPTKPSAGDASGGTAPADSVALRPADDPKFHLSRRPEYALLPLTELQATKVNAALGDDRSPDEYLSPSQLRLSLQIRQILSVDSLGMQSAEADMIPDRSPAGIAAYATLIRNRVASML